MDIVREDIASRQLNLSVQIERGGASRPRGRRAFAAGLLELAEKLPRNLHRPRGAVIVRTLNPGPHALLIEISDTGVGIEPEYAGEDFRRL